MEVKSRFLARKGHKNCKSCAVLFCRGYDVLRGALSGALAMFEQGGCSKLGFGSVLCFRANVGTPEHLGSLPRSKAQREECSGGPCFRAFLLLKPVLATPRRISSEGSLAAPPQINPALFRLLRIGKLARALRMLPVTNAPPGAMGQVFECRSLDT